MRGKNCIQEMMISAYLDGELSGDALKHAEEHLSNCPDCSAVYERLQADRDSLLECMPEVVPPAFVKQQLFRKIDAASEIRRNSGLLTWLGIRHALPFRSRAWTAACASFMLFAIMLSVFQYQRHLENGRILTQIDRAKAEWVSRYSSINPFNIDAKGAPLRISAENPFKFYLSER